LQIVNNGKRYNDRGFTAGCRIPEDPATIIALQYFSVDAYQK